MKLGTRIFFLALFFLGAPSIARAEPTKIDCSRAFLGKLTYSIVRQIVETCKIGRVEDLLPLLPEEYRKYHVLAFDSRSVQGASPQFPRIIFFGPDAKLILAVSGKENDPNGNTIEMIEWSEGDQKFKPRLLEFIKTKTDPTSVSEAHFQENPSSCVRCHRTNFRPNWDTYSLWPGFYGSDDGTIKNGTKEDEYFRSFLARVKRDPGRHGSLVGLQTLDKLPKEKDGSYEVANTESLEGTDRSGSPQVFFFTERLQDLNHRRIVQELKDRGIYDASKYAVLGALAGCPNYEDFFPKDWGVRLKETTGLGYDEVRKQVVLANRKYVVERSRRQYDLDPRDYFKGAKLPDPLSLSEEKFDEAFYEYAEGQTKAASKLRFLALIHGFDNEAWYLPFNKGSLHLRRTAQWQEQFAGVFLEGVLKTDPDLKAYYKLDPVKYQHWTQVYARAIGFRKREENDLELCSVLKKKSVAAEAKLSQPNYDAVKGGLRKDPPQDLGRHE